MSTSADAAVAYMLRRIRSDPRIAHYFANTESLTLLCKAHAKTSGLDADRFKLEFEASLATERPRCRSGECTLRTSEAAL